jgi:signal transduction histidine kinase/CheY-like chemotaxis protein
MENLDLNVFPNPVIVYNTRWNVLQVNHAILNTLGYRYKDDLIGRNIKDIIHITDHSKVDDIIKETESGTKQARRQNLIHKHCNGWPINLMTQFNRFAIEAGSGHVYFIESAFSSHEITANAIKPEHSFDNYAVLAENIPGLEVFLIDEYLKIYSRLGNETCRQEWKCEVYEGDNLSEYFPESIFNILQPLIRIAFEATPISQEFSHHNDFFSVRLVPLTEEGITTRCVIVLQNITETKMVENKLKLSKEESEEANRAKDNFVAKMSHEIRTPLNAISGFSEQLRNTRLTRRQQDYLQVVINSSQHLLSLVDDILVLSKIELGQVEMDETPFKIPDIIKTVHDILEIRYKEKKISFQTYFSPSLAEAVLGDPAKLRQVLINLTNNAIKFTHHGSITLRCTMVYETAQSKKVLFEVSDTGIGISKQDLDKIFLPFHQVDSSFDRNYSGCGLGLSISKDLIETMGGKLQVESTPSVGSTFSFTLEFKNIPTGQQPEDFVLAMNVPLDHIRIMFVDDDPVNRLLGEIILKKYKIKTDFVKSGLEAIKLFQPGIFDIIFLDINMPDINGMEVTRYIRQIESTSPDKSRTHIVAMTANAVSKHLKQYLMAGMDTIMLKPYDEETLYRKIISGINKEPQPEQHISARPDDDRSVDLDQLFKITRGDREFTLLMLNIFTANSEKLLNKIKFYYEKKDFAQIAESAHTLSPSMEQMGLEKATQLLKRIERKFLRQNMQQTSNNENEAAYAAADHQLILAAIEEVHTAIRVVKETTKKMKRQINN